MGKRLILSVVLAMTSMSIFAQTIVVSGVVRDVNSEVIPGANIFVVGTQNGVVSDKDGEYSVEMNIGEILSCSCLGFSTESIKITSAKQDFTLKEDINFLEESLVVGYGEVKKGDLTGAVSNIRMDKLASLSNNNSVFSQLQGRIPGLQVINSDQGPGATPSFYIRGISSISGTKSPLVVVDGFPLGEGSDLKQVITSEISDIVVLKDASSTSIYGSRGANGVIMITTKKASEGRTDVTFSHQTIISQFTQKLNIWRDPALMAELNNESRINAGQDPLYVGAYDNGTYYPSIEEINTTWPYRTDWEDLIMRTPIINNTTVAINSAHQKFSYNLAFSYYDDRGTYVSNTYKKLLVKVDVSYQIYRNLTLKSSNMLSKDWSNNFSADVGRNPLWPVYDEDGNYWQSSSTDYGNPIALLNTKKDKSQGTDVITSEMLTWDIIPGLKLVGQVNYKYGTTVSDLYNPKKYTEDGVFNNGHANISNWLSQSVLPEIYLTYAKDWNNGSSLSVMAGYSYDYYMERSSSLDAYDFVNEALAYENMAAGDPESSRVSNGYDESKLVSYYGKVNYSLFDRYLFTVTFRADGSSKFGANNKWAYFPSGAFAWKLHNEPFMKNVRFIDEAKIRVSYGTSGNQGISSYQTLSRYGTEEYYDNGSWNTAIGPGYIDGYYGSDYRFKYWSGIPNVDLKWETTSQVDVGFDFSILSNRLRFVFDWYSKHTYDLLRQRYLPLSSGYDKMWVNDGEVRNSGVEFSIDADIIRNANFSLNLTAIVGHNKNKVLSLGNVESSGLTVDPNTGMMFEFTGTPLTEQPVGTANILAVGYPMNIFYGYKTDGIVQSDAEGIDAGLTGDLAKAGEFKYVDINNDGIVDSNDRTIIGDPNPDLTASLNIAFRWKNLDVSVFLNGVFGNDVLYQYGLTNPATMPLRWTVDNPTNDYPSLRNNRQPYVSDWFVRDGSYVRIQDVTIGYTFNNFTKVLKNIRLYATINNLLTFTSFKGYDPEVGLDGIYWGGYPRFRKYTIGLSITF